jgi:hypothetical protein
MIFDTQTKHGIIKIHTHICYLNCVKVTQRIIPEAEVSKVIAEVVAETATEGDM